MVMVLDQVVGAKIPGATNIVGASVDDIRHDIISALKLSALNDKASANLLKVFETDVSALAEIASILSLSPYLRDCALINIEYLTKSLSGHFDRTLEEVISSTNHAWEESDTEADLMQKLRKAKRQIALTLGIGDLGGWLKPEEVTRYLSQFADATLESTSNYLLQELHKAGKIDLSDPNNPSKDSGLIVLGMGKYGAFELNYSSDIDIILFFDLTQKIVIKSDDPTSIFVRFAKQLSRILQERTGDGYVFRVDLRLRPDPGSTPLAIPIETAFNYYEAYGQNWERAAFIKARSVAGDKVAGNAFLKDLSPFIWRKYLDFAAIHDVHSIKRQIHAHKGFGEIAVKGHNVKLGRGGIREIEFFVQTQQLIAGGRREQLRVRGTINGLKALCADGWIDKETASNLERAYWYLRAVEHRIQMVADEQSHTLPEDEEGLLRIANMMGQRTTEDFSNEITSVMRLVEKSYAALFESAPALSAEIGNLVFTGDDEDPETVNTLAELGYAQPIQIISTVKGWHYGRYNAVRSSQAREVLTELTPTLLGAFSDTQNPDQALFSFDQFLSGLPAGLQFFSILKTNPNLIHLLSLILGSAPRLAEIITRRPHVFDGLIDPSFVASIPQKLELKERLEAAFSRVENYEGKLDQARIFAAEQRFLIGVRLINRTITARQAGFAFTDLAETLLSCLLQVVKDEFEQKHGIVDGGEFAVLGMGRLGSKDLTASSDLDLIFLYRHHENAEASNGDRPLYPQQYYIRLVQRLIAAMSAPTSEGVIYDLDFRLRPSGNSGPLATQLHSFEKYQMEEAWTWERQALVRARTIAGDEDILRDVDQTLDRLRTRKLDSETIAADILEMRETLDAEKPAETLFDVKRAEGGLIDIEFIAQWGALVSGKPDSSNHVLSTTELIENVPDILIGRTERETLKNAYELYNAILQIERVCLKENYDPETKEKGFETLLMEQVSQPDMKQLVSFLQETQGKVRKIFKEVLL